MRDATSTFLSPGRLLEFPFLFPYAKGKGQCLSRGSCNSYHKTPKPRILSAEKIWRYVNQKKYGCEDLHCWGQTRLLGTFYFQVFNFAGLWLHLLERGCAPLTAKPGFSGVQRGWSGLEI